MPPALLSVPGLFNDRGGGMFIRLSQTDRGRIFLPNTKMAAGHIRSCGGMTRFMLSNGDTR